MILKRNPIFQWLASIHDVWSLRRVQLFDMGHGRVGVAGVWRDDGPAGTGRNRYPDFVDTFIFDLRTTSKRDLQIALWQRLESRRKALLA
jgi:acyl-ACP thioesterase